MADIISALNMIMVPVNLLGLVMGVLVGIAFGCMPGLSVNMGLALLFPLAFTFHDIGGILMLAFTAVPSMAAASVRFC